MLQLTDETKRLRDRRKKPDDEKKSWTLKEIQNKHHQIKRMIFLGLSNKQIAEELGVTPQMVAMVKNSSIIRQQLKMMHAAADKEAIDLQSQIAEIAPIALKNIREVVETGELDGQSVTATARLREGNNILDRHMGKATQTVKGTHSHAHFTAEDIKQLKEEAMRAEGIIDV